MMRFIAASEVLSSFTETRFVIAMGLIVARFERFVQRTTES